QAEDGIRDFHVTGVQTCALPILLKTNSVRMATASHATAARSAKTPQDYSPKLWNRRRRTPSSSPPTTSNSSLPSPLAALQPPCRSEERRVGKEGRPRRSAEHRET